MLNGEKEFVQFWCLESVINLSYFIFVLYKNDQNFIHNENYDYSLYSVHKMCLAIQLVYLHRLIHLFKKTCKHMSIGIVHVQST